MEDKGRAKYLNELLLGFFLLSANAIMYTKLEQG